MYQDMSLGNYFSAPLFQNHGNDTVPETIMTVRSYGLVRFFMIDIFLINKKLSKLQGFIKGEWNWPISRLNDSETQERGL